MKQVNSGDAEADGRFPRGQTLQARMDVSRHPGQQCTAAVCSTLIFRPFRSFVNDSHGYQIVLVLIYREEHSETNKNGLKNLKAQ